MPGTNLTREEAAVRAAMVRVDSYDVDLDLGVDEQTFRSTTVARFGCDEPGASTFIDLIAPTVLEVRLNGVPLAVDQVVSEGRVALPALAAVNEVVVVAECAYMHTGEGLHRFVDPVDKEVYLYSQFEVADARRVFACFDQPDLKAVHTFTVTAPDHWVVISAQPTPEPSPVGAGRATWRFTPTPRLSTYVTAVVAGPYHRVGGEITSRDGRTLPASVLCRASLAGYLDADNILDVTRRGFAFYEELFDRAYAFDKYDQIFVPEFNAGAMENAGAVTFTEVYVFRSKVPEATIERRALTVLHELAHMWFGDLVTMRWWDDLWLNESFAEYASTRCQSEATRWTSAWTTFASAEKSWAYRQDQLGSTHPIVADIRDLADVEVNFDGITYAKGASVLKQLVHYVGQDCFDEGLRQYFRKHEWGNTTLHDLLAELEATSGRDLEAWAASWLQTAGVNTLRPRLTQRGGVIATAVVEQAAQPGQPTLRPHRLAVGCYDLVEGRLRRTRRIELDIDGPDTPVPDLVGSAQPALLLVNDDDLAYAKVRLDEASLATAVAHLGDFEDSLPRTLVWSAAWDMTRDAETRPRSFVDLLLGNITSVDDPSVAQTLLRQLSSTLMFYVAPEDRTTLTEDAAERLRILAGGAAPGSDAQLLYLRAFTGHASNPAHLDTLQALLDGTATMDGFTVDTERRWELLSALVLGGRAAEADIDRELDSDDTATGRIHAAAARAALPTREAKAAAWKSVVDDADLPNAVQAAVIGGFSRTHDTTLLEPFVEPYFACLSRVWAERTSEMATQIVVGLYPTVLASQALLDRTQQWLDENGSEPSLARLVVENRDGVTRALRAQARDRLPA